MTSPPVETVIPEISSAAKEASRQEADHAPPVDESGETGEFNFGEAHSTHAGGMMAGGLSPLVIGMLLGMIVLTGLAGWLVLQSRIGTLEEQFIQLDERLQVVMGDLRRQGETLRTLVANPAVPRPAEPAKQPEPARAVIEPARVTSLEESLTEQRGQLASAEKKIARHTTQLSELERRATQLESRPVAIPSVSMDRKEAPLEPPVGYVVILASLPVREQALQQLDLLRAKGLKVVLREARVKGRTWYRVQAEGFHDRDSAAVYARTAEDRYGVTGAWVAAP
jgi:cell division septation protein DedD